MLQYGIRASFFNTELGWDEKVDLKRNVTEDLFQSGQISVCGASMVKSNNNWAELGKIPIVFVKFMRKWRNSSMR
jgi:hypothetical protein